MNEDMTEMHRLRGELPPAAMPDSMRCRLLAAMERELTELQADAGFEAELLSLVRPTAVPLDTRQRLIPRLKEVQPRRRWGSAAAAAVVLLLVATPILWWAPWGKPRPVGMTVELQRCQFPATAGAPAIRQDTFVMQGADNSHLVIRVQATVDSQLPEEVI